MSNFLEGSVFKIELEPIFGFPHTTNNNYSSAPESLIC